MGKYYHKSIKFEKTKPIDPATVAGYSNDMRERIMRYSEADLLRIDLQNVYARYESPVTITEVILDKDIVEEYKTAYASGEVKDKNNEDWAVYGHWANVEVPPWHFRYSTDIPARPADPSRNRPARQAIKAGDVRKDEQGNPIVYTTYEVFCMQYKDIDDRDEQGNPKMKYIKGNEPKQKAMEQITALHKWATASKVAGNSETERDETPPTNPEPPKAKFDPITGDPIIG